MLPPGATIGILGGGQLGRMLVMAAARLGFRCVVFCQRPDEPAAQVCGQVVLAAFDDLAALNQFARRCDVITLEWENIPTAALEQLQQLRPVCPNADVLAITQDRLHEKQTANQLGLATAPFQDIASANDLAAAATRLGYPCILKTRRMGYDGKGQFRLQSAADLTAAWEALGAAAANSGLILEGYVNFVAEISVIVARHANGTRRSFPVVTNTHVNGILVRTEAPAQLSVKTAAAATLAAERLAERLQVVGLLAVEMFVTAPPDGAESIIINEMAPRPHNSGHWTMDGCATSQFEQLIRAICGLPLGSTNVICPTTMHNLLGEQAAPTALLPTLSDPQARLHLYGKSERLAGRKMGHVNVLRPITAVKE